MLNKDVIKISCSIVLLMIVLHPGRFAVMEYTVVGVDQLCNCSTQAGRLTQQRIRAGNVMLNELLVQLMKEEGFGLTSRPQQLAGYSCHPGGLCLSSSTSLVAIVIPYRDRTVHSSILLPYLHTFLQLQGLDYRLVLVEQSSGSPFNRAQLLNIGAREAGMLLPAPHCLVFHDVDLLPVSLETLYTCLHRPLHLSAHLDEFRYLLPYRELVGGVLAMSPEQFTAVDGFSNDFFGWGGEDDDFYTRLQRQALSPVRLPPHQSRYKALPHPKQAPPGPGLRPSHMRPTSGLSTLQYNLTHIRLHPMATHILVDI